MYVSRTQYETTYIFVHIPYLDEWVSLLPPFFFKEKQSSWFSVCFFATGVYTLSQTSALFMFNSTCTTFHRYPIFSTRYSVMCKVCTGYCGTSEVEHGLCAYTVDNPLAKARGLSLRTGAQPMLYLPQGVSE